MTFATVARSAMRAGRSGLRASGPALRWGLSKALGADEWPELAVPPPARPVRLPGRGTTYVIDIPGPRPDAPTVLLLHGIFTSGGLTWFSVMEELARDYRVVTFDQRWHGRGILSEGFTLDDCADDAAALLDVLEVPQVIVAGYSMGGATAQVFVRRHPERVAGLVLCSTAPRWEGHLGERVFYAFLAAINRGLAGTAYAKVLEHRARRPDLVRHVSDVREWALAELRHTSPWAIPTVMGELGGFDATGWLGEVTVPTAVVITARDHAIPTARQRHLAALLPDPHVFEAPGGHTSLVFDLHNWRPLFLEAVAVVAGERSARDVL